MDALPTPPQGLDHEYWLARWDTMQEHYIPRRDERLKLLGWIAAEVPPSTQLVVDLGCGTGSVMEAALGAAPECEVVGIDLDPTLLVLAERRLAGHGARARFLRLDLRRDDWVAAVGSPVDAVLSATALHWLSADQLADVYQSCAEVLRPGGVLANADHVDSGAPGLRAAWRRVTPVTGGEWEAFWRDYAEALGIADIAAFRGGLIGTWSGVEEGLPLTWQFSALLEAGFTSAECFWRDRSDAVYGGIR